MSLLFQFITETLREARAAQARAFRLSPAQRKQAKANMSRIAAEVLDREKRKGKPKRKPDIDWADLSGDRITGWWHPDKPAHLFGWRVGSNQHVNQIARFPATFGVTKEQVRKAAEDYTEYTVGISRGSAKWEEEVETTIHRLQDGEIDADPTLTKFAYANGWVMIRKSGMIRMDGAFSGSRRSLKALFREILDTLDSAEKKPEMFQIEVGVTDSGKEAFTLIRNREAIERFLNS